MCAIQTHGRDDKGLNTHDFSKTSLYLDLTKGGCKIFGSVYLRKFWKQQIKTHFCRTWNKIFFSKSSRFCYLGAETRFFTPFSRFKPIYSCAKVFSHLVPISQRYSRMQKDFRKNILLFSRKYCKNIKILFWENLCEISQFLGWQNFVSLTAILNLNKKDINSSNKIKVCYCKINKLYNGLKFLCLNVFVSDHFF